MWVSEQNKKMTLIRKFRNSLICGGLVFMFSCNSNFSLVHTPCCACIIRESFQTVWPLRTAMSWQLMGVDRDGMKCIPDILLCTSLTSLYPVREEIWEEDQLDATLSWDLASVLFTRCGRTVFWLIPSLSELGKLTGSTRWWDCKKIPQNCDYDGSWWSGVYRKLKKWNCISLPSLCPGREQRGETLS